ncbi:hypothetical protein [Carnobacterium pleistocenium]|uniref:hypothetical protein n=1 Tax=Carnobacterium pleistocenium TaxID=181073 RepID=UPI00054E0283|nr:hypothetical protein [Carnobacterium pleistocenium]
METTKELFNEYLDGNSFNGELDEFEKYMMGVVKDSYEVMLQESPESYPEVYLGIVNDYTFNAIAFKYKNNYFIGLNIGLIRIVKNFYNYLFSRNDVFKEIDTSEEQNPDIDINLSELDNYIDTIGDLFNNYDFESVYPKSKERKNNAKHFAANAVSYLFFHEYGHIVHGHLDYSIKTNKNFVFFESNSKNEGNLISQCLEMDADSFAATKTISLIKDPEFWSGSALTTGFSSVFMFQLLSTKIDNLNELSNYSHPIPAIRQMIYLNMVYAFFYQFSEKSAEEIAFKVVDVVLKEHKIVFMDVLGLEKESLAIVNSVNEKVNQHFKIIMNTWNEIRDDLSKYAYGPIAEKKIWK